MELFSKSFDLKDILLVAMAAFIAFSLFTDQGAGTKHGTDFQNIAPGVVQGRTEIVHKIDMAGIDEIIAKSVNSHMIKARGEIKATIDAKWQERSNEGGTNVEKYGVKKKELYWQDETGARLPIGVALYSPNKDAKGIDPWLSKTYQIDYTAQIVRSEDYDGGVHNTVSVWASSPSRKGYEDVKLRLNIKDAQFQELQDKPLVWSWWNPTVSLGAYTAIPAEYGIIGKFNFMNYGYEKQLPVFQILSPTFMLTAPSSYNVGLEIGSVNLGEYLPLIKDLHLGAGITLDKKPFATLTSVF